MQSSSKKFIRPPSEGGVLDVGRYRWRWLKRAVNGSANDYSSLSNLVEAVNDPTASNYIAKVEGLVDVEEWMRLEAFSHIVGNIDSYGWQAGHNMYAYKPTN